MRTSAAASAWVGPITFTDLNVMHHAQAAAEVIAFLRGQGIRAAVGGTAALRFRGWMDVRASDVDILASRAPNWAPEDLMLSSWKFDDDPSWKGRIGSPVVDGVKVDILPIGAEYQNGLTYEEQERAWLAAATGVRFGNLVIPVFRMEDAFAWKWAAGRRKDVDEIRRIVRSHIRPDYWYPWMEEYRDALDALDKLGGGVRRGFSY